LITFGDSPTTIVSLRVTYLTRVVEGCTHCTVVTRL